MTLVVTRHHIAPAMDVDNAKGGNDIAHMEPGLGAPRWQQRVADGQFARPRVD